MDGIVAALTQILRSPAFKFFVIGALILVLLIPLFLVAVLIGERTQRAEGVRRDVAAEWGGAQVINGPMLIVPYTVRRLVAQGDKTIEEIVERRAVFLPQRLSVSGEAATRLLHRSIYDVAVYASTLDLEGSFAAPQISEVAADVHAVRWRDAVLAVAISDVSGLKTVAALDLGDQGKLDFEPSLGVPSVRGSGIHARLGRAPALFGTTAAEPDGPLGSVAFKFRLVLNGSDELKVAPVAQETSMSLVSDWGAPSFIGAFLPTDRTIEANRFTAHWQVPHLARSVPQAWVIPEQDLSALGSYAFGVRFFVPVDFYQLVSRAAKYAVMFIATAFMAVFLLELHSGRNVHPVQYFFVGLAIIFFYVLLLSLAEQVGFALAYAIAAGATGTLLTVYVGRVQRGFGKGLVMGVIFLVLYGLLYMILQLEDYALLAGAVVGFLMLAVVMFATLGVDWSGRKTGET